MKRPLLMVALFYGAGIFFGDVSPVSAPILPLLAGTLMLALLGLCWAGGRLVVVWALLPLVGATNLTLHKAALSPFDLRAVVGDQPQIVSVRGLLCETPYHRVYEHHDLQAWRTLAQLQLAAIRLQDHDWQPAHGSITVSTPGILPAEFCGG